LKFFLVQETTESIKELQIVSKSSESLHLHKSTSSVLDTSRKEPVFLASLNEFLDEM